MIGYDAPLPRAVRALWLFPALAACRSLSPEIVVEVDADDAVVERLVRVTIAVEDGETTPDMADVMLTGTAPACLPLSAGVVPKTGHEDLPIRIAVTGTFFDGQTISDRVDT